MTNPPGFCGGTGRPGARFPPRGPGAKPRESRAPAGLEWAWGKGRPGLQRNSAPSTDGPEREGFPVPLALLRNNQEMTEPTWRLLSIANGLLTPSQAPEAPSVRQLHTSGTWGRGDVGRDNAPAVCRPPPRNRSAAGRPHEERKGGRRGPGWGEACAAPAAPAGAATATHKVRCSGAQSREPAAVPGPLGRGRGSLASDASKDALVERPPCPAPPGRLEDRPRLRAYWDRVAPSLGASRKFGLRERVQQAGKAPAGAMRTDRGRRESGSSCQPRAPRVRLGRRGASRGIGRVCNVRVCS